MAQRATSDDLTESALICRAAARHQWPELRKIEFVWTKTSRRGVQEAELRFGYCERGCGCRKVSRFAITMVDGIPFFDPIDDKIIYPNSGYLMPKGERLHRGLALGMLLMRMHPEMFTSSKRNDRERKS